MRTVAALYTDPRGPYPLLNVCGCYDRKAPRHVCTFSSQVDCWDEVRDARKYDGPHPVVAHPPCGPWSKLRHLCNEATLATSDCGPRAVEQVRRWGGVLEHPEKSKLWDWCGLPKPSDATDCYDGRTYLVHQVDWGHVCVKPTWLYVVGVDQTRVMRNIRARRGKGTATHCVCTGPRQLKRLPVASKPLKRRSPPLFAEWLVSLARASEVSQ